MVEASLGESTKTPTAVFAVIEDDPDILLLIETISSIDPRFTLANVAETAAKALEWAQTMEPGIFELDHNLAGPLTGLAATPLLQELAANAKIILFTAYAELQTPATAEPPVDALLLRTDSTRLPQLAQPLTGPGADRFTDGCRLPSRKLRRPPEFARPCTPQRARTSSAQTPCGPS
jgi:DNA-binding LytR/AlgR family response regulator